MLLSLSLSFSLSFSLLPRSFLPQINEAAEMQWHLERARIVFAIEHEIGEAERSRRANKYW
jgi:hypothetical protein